MRTPIGHPIVMFLCALAGTISAIGRADTLEVGPGKPLTKIEEANDLAKPGDVILVYPQDNGKPYEQSAVFVRQRDLTFRRPESACQPRPYLGRRLRLQRERLDSARRLPVQCGGRQLRFGGV